MSSSEIALIIISSYGALALVVGPILARRQRREIEAALRAHEEYRREYARIFEASDARLR